MCFLHNIENLYNLSEVSFHGEFRVNVMTRMVSMEIVWRQCGERYFLWRFYGKISLEIVLGFHGENMVNQITRMVSMEIVGRQCGQ